MSFHDFRSSSWPGFRNDAGEACPPSSLVRVTGQVVIDGESVLTVTKPDGAGGTYLITSPFEVDDGQFGDCSREPSVFVTYDTANSPAVGEDWGPVSGSWKLSQDGGGWTLCDTGDGTLVRVSPTTGTAGLEFMFVTVTITAATWASGPEELTRGSGKGVRLKDVGAGKWKQVTPATEENLYNLTNQSFVVPTTGDAVLILPAVRRGGDLYVLWSELRGLPGFALSADQSPYHSSGEEHFRIGADPC